MRHLKHAFTGAPGQDGPDRRPECHPESETPPCKVALLEGKDHDNEQVNSATRDAERKLFDGLRADLALAGGHALHQLADGTYKVTWRQLSRSLPDLNAVAAFAHQVGVRT